MKILILVLAESSPLPPKNEGPSQRTYYRRDSTGRLVKCDEDASDVANRPNEIIPGPHPLVPGKFRIVILRFSCEEGEPRKIT